MRGVVRALATYSGWPHIQAATYLAAVTLSELDGGRGSCAQTAQSLHHPSLTWSAMPLSPECLTPIRVIIIHNIGVPLGELRTKVRVALPPKVPTEPRYPCCMVQARMGKASRWGCWTSDSTWG